MALKAGIRLRLQIPVLYLCGLCDCLPHLRMNTKQALVDKTQFSGNYSLYDIAKALFICLHCRTCLNKLEPFSLF